MTITVPFVVSKDGVKPEERWFRWAKKVDRLAKKQKRVNGRAGDLYKALQQAAIELWRRGNEVRREFMEPADRMAEDLAASIERDIFQQTSNEILGLAAPVTPPTPATVEDLTEMYASLPYEEVLKHGEAVANALVLFAQARGEIPKGHTVKLVPKQPPMYVLHIDTQMTSEQVEQVKQAWDEQRKAPILPVQRPKSSCGSCGGCSSCRSRKYREDLQNTERVGLKR